MKLIFILLLSFFSFKSCMQEKSVLYVKMDNAYGLKANDAVVCKGVEVGNVEDVQIKNNQVIATIELKQDYKPTKGTIAKVKMENFLGKKNLELFPTENTILLANGDTISAKNSDAISILEDIIKSNNIDSLKNSLNFDDFNLDSLPVNIDSLGIDKYIEKAKKIMDLDKLFQ